MGNTRRAALKAAFALSAKSAIVPLSVGSALLSGCGGGGDAGPAAPPAPPPPSGSPPPSGLSYPSSESYLVGTAITPVTPAVTGSVTAYSISPALPAGLTLNTSTGVISGTPTAAAAATTYTITASNAGGATTASISITVAAKLAIVSASSSTPMALTPLSLVMTGLDVSKPYSVNVAYPNGTKLTLPPIRATSTGGIVVATPLYIDPTTGRTASVDVNVSVTQGSATSNSLPLSIHDIPTVASYGLAPGVISRTFLNYLTVSLGRSKNYLQALQAFPANKTNTSSARSAINQQMLDTIEMRNNIDMLMAGTQASLGVGKTSKGSPIQFNPTSVDMMDRILAMHIRATGFATAAASLAMRSPATPMSASLGGSSPMPRFKLRVRNQRLRARRMKNAFAPGLPQSAAAAPGIPQAADLKSAVTVLATLGGVTGMINGEINAFQPVTSTNTLGDDIASGIGGLAAVAGLIGLAAEAPAIITGAAVVGAVVGAYTVARDVQNILQSPEGLTWESGAKVTFDAVGTVAAVFGAAAVGTGLVREVTSALEAVGGDGVSGLVLQGAGFISNIGATTLGVIALGESAHEESAHASPAQQVGLLEGSTSVTNDAGPILSGLPGIVLDEPNTGAQFTSMSDTSNQFEFFVPIGVSGYDYREMTLFTYDPVTSSGTGSAQLVDLRGLSSTIPVIDNQPVVGACVDDDAGNPDADDPDCD